MKKYLLLLLGGITSTYSFSQGFKTQGATLLDANNNPFVIKGLNVPLAWFETDVNNNIANIKTATNANTLRIVVGAGITPLQGTGGKWNTPDNVWQATVQKCIENKMIPMLEVHNILGSNDSLDLKAVTDWWVSKKDYLTRPDIAKYILINIANEWGDWKMSRTDQVPNQTYWRDSYITAVKRLRAAGIKTTIVIDAPGYGQDYMASTLLNHGKAVIDADPEKNILFAIHTYCEWKEGGSSNAATLFPQLKQKGLPFIVGEVASSHPENGNVCEINETQIMALSAQYNSGYLGWSWKGNTAGTDLESLDIAKDWAGTQLTPWGETLVNGLSGTKTAVEASIFGSTSTNKNPTVSITAPATNSTYPAPANITITATASDTDGTISRVEFYSGSTKLGQDLIAPYTLEWNNVARGTYYVYAVAVDNLNGTTLSDEVALVITSSDGNLLTNGEFNEGLTGWSLDKTAPAEGTYTVVTDANLSGTNALKVCPTTLGTADWNLQLITNVALTTNTDYELSFLAKADAERAMGFGFQQSISPFLYYFGGNTPLTTALKPYSFKLSSKVTDPSANLKIYLGTSTACVYIDNIVFVPVQTTGLTDGNDAASIAVVYPNPFKNQLVIQTQGDFIFEIKDQLGRIVDSGKGTDQVTTGSQLPKGLYLLNIHAGSKSLTSKIVKE